MPTKTRFTFYAEPEKLSMLRALFTENYGDVPGALRASIDAILQACADDPDCPMSIRNEIIAMLANGDDNRPPRPVFPAPTEEPAEAQLVMVLDELNPEHAARLRELLAKLGVENA